jgi:hypothetical protein
MEAEIIRLPTENQLKSDKHKEKLKDNEKGAGPRATIDL